MRIECPGCHSELDMSNTQCPFCLRPRSRHEMMQSLNAVRKEEEKRRKRPYKIAGGIVLGIAVLYGLSTAQRMGFFTPAPKPKPVAAVVPSAPPSVAGPDVSGPPNGPSTSSPAPLPVPTQNPTPAATLAPTEPAPPEDWRVHGVVYDLLSLKPAANTRLTFTDKGTGQTAKAKTDARGRYSIHLPKLTDGGYAVAVNAKGYRGDYLEEGIPPYADRTRAGREDAAAEAAQSQVLHVPLFLDKETSLEYNLALLPHE